MIRKVEKAAWYNMTRNETHIASPYIGNVAVRTTSIDTSSGSKVIMFGNSNKSILCGESK